ncbi:DUF6512 family protein [Microbulbifer guangxiensis]|uniref:DUF6512 family protein n=1 Tax=Microbulbifer guangxiensis TaxID=2904249 RepID=UPI001F198781|nr:DUF6512 family protein [Microbulbifer guangxiensis]
MKQTPPSERQLGESRKRQILAWELIGALWILVAGGLLHFAFDWGGRWRAIAAFVPVNESVWEHLKMLFWPGLLFAMWQLRFTPVDLRQFLTAKCLSLSAMPLILITLFYTYTAILNDNYLALDILCFMIATAIGQWMSYSLLIRHSEARVWRVPGLVGMVFFLFAFSLFTFFPPHLPLFEHQQTGQYGIIPE